MPGCPRRTGTPRRCIPVGRTGSIPVSFPPLRTRQIRRLNCPLAYQSG
ncbi:hypothetical protein C7S14_6239 [Burkholderia cepacia]|nr:hypothetical protein C7S14_6239 [Burkholderia cepacia]